MRHGVAAAAAVMVLATGAAAEPAGRWFGGLGQGAAEYGVKNDNAGSDGFYIACLPDGASIMLTVGGRTPVPLSTVSVLVDADAFELATDASGDFSTASRDGHTRFLALWDALRDGDALQVRLSTGQSARFSLSGTAKVLPRQHCRTAFER